MADGLNNGRDICIKRMKKLTTMVIIKGRVLLITKKVSYRMGKLMRANIKKYLLRSGTSLKNSMGEAH